ncbi:MAG: J domain-containing protein [Clostridia bacterium]|nr:J domain-containing protein [Clostridia bacterium]
MNKNPYTVLGVPENSTDEQIKTAYRDLAKKYHPDNYEDSPLRDLAMEKMKEINEAYDEIQRLRKEGRSYTSSASSAGYNAQHGYTRTSYPDIRSLIQSGRLDDAQTLLSGVPADRRDAEWYFLSGMVSYRRGWTDQAYDYFKTACDMDPRNMEFRQSFSRINQQRNYRSPEYNRTVNSHGCSSCDICAALCCADTCCECMGGDLCRCC